MRVSGEAVARELDVDCEGDEREWSEGCGRSYDLGTGRVDAGQLNAVAELVSSPRIRCGYLIWMSPEPVPTANGGATAVDGAGYVVAVEAALHGDGLGDIDVAGAGVGVEVEVRVADGEVDGAAAGGELPVAGGLALGVDVAGAGAGFEARR